MGSRRGNPDVHTHKIRRTVLIVEDEVLVRLATAEHLIDLGYNVLQAVNGDEALRILAAHRDIDLVFSDNNMPGSITGQDLAHIVRRDYPGIKFLLTSGVGWRRGTEEAPFLAKPYMLFELTDRLQRILDGAD